MGSALRLLNLRRARVIAAVEGETKALGEVGVQVVVAVAVDHPEVTHLERMLRNHCWIRVPSQNSTTAATRIIFEEDVTDREVSVQAHELEVVDLCATRMIRRKVRKMVTTPLHHSSKEISPREESIVSVLPPYLAYNLEKK